MNQGFMAINNTLPWVAPSVVYIMNHKFLSTVVHLLIIYVGVRKYGKKVALVIAWCGDCSSSFLKSE